MRLAFILSGLNFCLILVILFLLKTHRPVKYMGFFVIFTQILIIFCAIITRACGLGFSPIIILLLTSIPAFFPLVSKFLSKFKKKNQELNLFQKLNFHLDQAFFNIFFFNKGLNYFYEVASRRIEKAFREKIKTPHILINKVLIYPWIVFLSTASFEILLFNHCYLAPVLLGLNLLIFRIVLIFLKIIEKTANENLKFIGLEIFHRSLEKQPRPYYIQFVNETRLISILDNNNENPENVINKCLGVISGNCYASAVLQSKILKNFLLPWYFIELNKINVFVLLSLVCFPSIFLLVFAFMIISGLSSVFFETKHLQVNELIYHLLRLNKALGVYRNSLFLQLSEIPAKAKLLSEPLERPLGPKPKNFREFFQKYETFRIFPEDYVHKPSLWVLVKQGLFTFLKILGLFLSLLFFITLVSFLKLLGGLVIWIMLF